MFCNFLLQLNMAKRRHVFKRFGPWNSRKKWNWQKTKIVLTCSSRKVIRAWKIRQFILFQNSWNSLIASSISFNLIWGFRCLPFKLYMLHRLHARHPWRYTVTLRKNRAVKAAESNHFSLRCVEIHLWRIHSKRYRLENWVFCICYFSKTKCKNN